MTVYAFKEGLRDYDFTEKVEPDTKPHEIYNTACGQEYSAKIEHNGHEYEITDLELCGMTPYQLRTMELKHDDWYSYLMDQIWKDLNHYNKEIQQDFIDFSAHVYVHAGMPEQEWTK